MIPSLAVDARSRSPGRSKWRNVRSVDSPSCTKVTSTRVLPGGTPPTGPPPSQPNVNSSRCGGVEREVLAAHHAARLHRDDERTPDLGHRLGGAPPLRRVAPVGSRTPTPSRPAHRCVVAARRRARSTSSPILAWARSAATLSRSSRSVHMSSMKSRRSVERRPGCRGRGGGCRRGARSRGRRVRAPGGAGTPPGRLTCGKWRASSPAATSSSRTRRRRPRRVGSAIAWAAGVDAEGLRGGRRHVSILLHRSPCRKYSGGSPPWS